MTLDALARRFGLRWSEDAGTTSLRRGARAAQFRGQLLTDDADGRYRAFCTVLGTRLGLDLQESGAATKAVQRVIPRAAVDLAKAISGRNVSARALTAGSRLDVVAVAESGKLQLLTEASEDSARELFYSTYKVRAAPAPEGAVPVDARVTRWQEPGGLAPSLASLLPDFDLDTARDGGFVFVPSWTQLVIVRGAPPAGQLRALGRQLLADAAMPMSRRVYRLTLDGLVAGEVVGVAGELDGAELVENLIDVTP